MKKISLFLLLFLLQIGCFDGSESRSGAKDPNKKGTNTSAVDEGFKNIALAKITLDNAPGWCTGTLIADNFILTAGHCFDDHGGKKVKAKTVSIVKPDGTYLLFPAAQIDSSGEFFALETHFKDIGYVKLATGAGPSVKPIAIATGIDVLPTGEAFSFFGFSSNVLSDMTKSAWQPDPAHLFMALNEWKKWTIVASLKGTASASSGDSGGPLLIKKNGEWLLVGVLQGDTWRDPGDMSRLTFTPAEKALAEIALKAGAAPKTEPVK